MKYEVMGIRGESFGKIADAVRGMGGEAVLLEPSEVRGADHLASAVMHAERAFSEGRNRSDSMVTEIIVYAAGERQIGKAIATMKPRGNCFAAIVIGVDFDPASVGAVRDDSILRPTVESDDPFLSAEDAALERTALLDIQKM